VTGDAVDLPAIRNRLRADLESLRSPDGYLRAGSPRYATLFGRDSLVAAWQTLAIDPSIAAATLRTLAAFQGRREDARSEEEPGKILHEHRFDATSRSELSAWDFPYYGSVDATLLFLIVADEYVRLTNDKRILHDLWPAFAAAHEWIDVFGDRDRDGFVEYERKNPQGLFHQGWKDGSEDHLHIAPPVALVEVQGYAVAAHRAFATLAERMGHLEVASSARRTASDVEAKLNRAFWMSEARYYALGLDGAKSTRRAITSNPGHLLAMHVVPNDRIDPLIARLFQPDMWTPYGVRTHATSEPDFDPYGYHTGTIWPHDNWFLWRGLRAARRIREADRIREALLRAYADLGKIPELYAFVDSRLEDLSAGTKRTLANPLQAWSTGALIDMVTQDGPRA